MGFERPTLEEEAKEAGEMPSDLSRGADTTDRPFTIPVRPKGARASSTRGPSGWTKLALLFISIAAIGVYYYNSQTQAVTTINTTITENDDLNNGLIGHWTFDGPDMDWSSTTAEVRDVSGNNNHGNLVTLVTFKPASPGRIGQALELSGAAYVNVGGSNLTGATSISYSTWVRTDNTKFDGAFRSLIDDAQSDYSLGGVTIMLDDRGSSEPTNGLTAIIDVSTGNCVQASVSNVIASSPNWYHIAFTYNGSGSVKQLYINGTAMSVSSGSCTGSGNFVPDTNDNMYLGAISPGSNILNGRIDDTRIYNRALSASEVQRLYELGATTHINTTIDTNDDLENGLVGHWTFDGPKMAWASTTAEVLDSSTSSIEGDATNMDRTSVAIGKIGQGLNFDGVNDNINLGTSIPIRFDTTGSISAWIKTDCSDVCIIVGGNSTTEYSGYNFFIDFGVLTFRSDKYHYLTTPWVGVYDDGSWHHVVITKNGSNGILYVDDEVKSSTASLTYNAPWSTNPIYIGNEAGRAYYFQGAMDDVRIYNRALSASEVKRLHELGATTHINTTIDTNDDLENGLVGHWTFDGPKMAWASTTAEVLDSSISGREGDLINMDMQSVAIGKIGQGLDFNGTDDRVEIPFSSVLPSTDFTVAVWAFLDTNTDEVLIMLPNITGGNEFLMHASSSAFGITTNELVTTYGSVPIPQGKWTHIVARRSGSSVTSYINAVQDLSYSDAAALETNCRLYFGVDVDAGSCTSGLSNFLDGKLDDIRIYDRALSIAEIKRLYELGGGR